jgi:hypothetical protein
VLSPVLRQTSTTTGFYFRCTRYDCRYERSVKTDTFFEKTRLRIGQVLAIIFYFTQNEATHTSLKRKTGILRNETLGDWLSFCRDICIFNFKNHPVVLGGIGVRVECDEALLVKRKYNVGWEVLQQWVFGMYDVSLKQGICIAVPDRRRETHFL